jgi:transposase
VGGDTGDSRPNARRTARQRGIRPVIPTTANARAQRQFARELDRERNPIERGIHRLTQYRRVATRDETLAVNDRTMVTIAAILIWL